MRLTTLTLCLSILHLASPFNVEAKPVVRTLSERAKITALKDVGLALFRIKSNAVTPAQAAMFRTRLAYDLTGMSFLNVSVTDDGSALDGTIVGEFSAGRINSLIRSRTGETLVKISIVHKLNFETPAGVKEASHLLVDKIARAMPYRGFLTKKIDDDVYEMNLGSRQGILKGQRFRAFDFSTAEFASLKLDLGEIQVIAIAEDTSTVEILSGDSVGTYSKIGFAENTRGMVSSSQMETRGYAYLGGMLLSVNSAGEAPYSDRGYDFTTTPGFLVGGGWGRFSLRAALAQAKGKDIDFVFTEILGHVEIYEKVSGLNRYTIRAGARFARMGVSTKASLVTPIATTMSLSPSAEARVDRVIGGPVRGFAQADANYPVFVTGADLSALIFSYGLGVNAGLSLDLSRIFIDLGGRYHTYRRPIVGSNAVQEGFAEYFAHVGARF